MTASATPLAFPCQPGHPQPRNLLAQWLYILCVCAAVLAAAVPPAGAQTLQAIAPLHFVKTVNSTSNPLPQVLTVSSTSTTTNPVFSVSVVSGTGGNWLTTDGTGGSYYTPRVLTVSANPDVSLAAGTYTAQVVLKIGTTSFTVPVSLAVESSANTYFDELPGALTYSLVTAGTAPPAQLVPIRNGGAGKLTFSATTSTADGGGWISLSSTSGTAPYQLSVAINPSKLPGLGQVAGTFTGGVLLTAGSNSVSIPVSVTVGKTPLLQINPLSFTKTLDSLSESLSQVLTVASDNPSEASVVFSVAAYNGTGGTWLTTDVTGGSYYAPRVTTVSATPNVSLAAGTYTGQVVLSTGSQAVVVPVTLAVESPSSSYFDELAGALTFSMQTAGSPPPAELLPIRNGGTGSLAFTASTSTADGGKWLTLSATSGTAPYQMSVGITPGNLPGLGKIAGTFTGQVILQTGADIVTVPVTVTVADDILLQVNPLAFTKTLDSTSEPLSQVITVANTDPANHSVVFSVSVISGTGGNWLTTNSTGGSYYAPHTVTVAANPDVSLAAGTYTAEIRLSSQTQAVLIPVSLTIVAPAGPHFDELQGQLTFSLKPAPVSPHPNSCRFEMPAVVHSASPRLQPPPMAVNG